jgi:hypothetical protein
MPLNVGIGSQTVKRKNLEQAGELARCRGEVGWGCRFLPKQSQQVGAASFVYLASVHGYRELSGRIVATTPGRVRTQCAAYFLIATADFCLRFRRLLVAIGGRGRTSRLDFGHRAQPCGHRRADGYERDRKHRKDGPSCGDARQLRWRPRHLRALCVGRESGWRSIRHAADANADDRLRFSASTPIEIFQYRDIGDHVTAATSYLPAL